ncbi:hypothetical protein AB0D09_31500 [Streptomyces sp. NPDC049097]|uniref:hypothetical protein n=1 Tax=Streptomyces sp. NPDC049097 TaxID=3155497 RepID=UPI003417868A
MLSATGPGSTPRTRAEILICGVLSLGLQGDTPVLAAAHSTLSMDITAAGRVRERAAVRGSDRVMVYDIPCGS